MRIHSALPPWLFAATTVLFTSLSWSQPLPSGKLQIKSTSVLIMDEGDETVLGIPSKRSR